MLAQSLSPCLQLLAESTEPGDIVISNSGVMGRGWGQISDRGDMDAQNFNFPLNSPKREF